MVLAWASHSYYSDLKEFALFNDAKFKKSSQQIKMITALAYQFSIFILGNVAFIFLFTTLFSFSYENRFIMAVRRNISNSLEQFVIFLGLYAYILFQGRCILWIIQLDSKILSWSWLLTGSFWLDIFTQSDPCSRQKLDTISDSWDRYWMWSLLPRWCYRLLGWSLSPLFESFDW